jgi:hypothetical protein
MASMGEFKRNIRCKYYNKCLNEAVKDGKDFNCRGCRYENERHEENSSDTFGYYLLFLAVYFLEIYNLYRRIERAGDLVILNRFERFIVDYFDGDLSKL